MKEYTKPTITCVKIAYEQMIAATIPFSDKDAEHDACGKETTLKHFSLWDDLEEEEEEDYR